MTFILGGRPLVFSFKKVAKTVLLSDLSILVTHFPIITGKWVLRKGV